MGLKDILGDELYEQVDEKLGEDNEIILAGENDGDYVPRSRLNDKTGEVEKLESQIEELQGQIEQRDTQLEQLKNDTQTSKELKQRIEQLEEENEEQADELQSKLEQKETEILKERKARAVETKLASSGAKHPNLLMKEVDLDGVEINDKGKVEGVDDVISGLQENYEDLFGKESVKGNTPNKSGKTPESNPDKPDMNTFIRQKAGR